MSPTEFSDKDVEKKCTANRFKREHNYIFFKQNEDNVILLTKSDIKQCAFFNPSGLLPEPNHKPQFGLGTAVFDVRVYHPP